MSPQGRRSISGVPGSRNEPHGPGISRPHRPTCGYATCLHRRHNDRELSCKDEGRLEGSLRPESRPPALSASNDMLCGHASSSNRTRGFYCEKDALTED